jgi:large subunit ribosomal protein L30
MTAKIRVTQVRSLISRPEPHRRTVKALGLKRINHSVIHEDKPEIRGMIDQVRYLIRVEKIEA